jgi:pimeloyl-ACP methyl ester carboxylesterase
VAVDPGFYERYDAVMARWPVPHEGLDLDGRYGSTHVNACGEPDTPPIVLIPGGRSTSAVYYATVGALAAQHRVYAIDILGDRGRSVRSEVPMRTLDAVMEWLDEVLDGLNVSSTALAGHSMGANYAARYALHAPDRIAKLVLFDPTNVFSGTPLPYLVRALPLIVGRGADRFRTFNQWESGDRVDPLFLDLFAGEFGGVTGTAFPKRLTAAEVAGLTLPVLVFAAMASKQDVPRKLIAGARTLPDGRIVEIPGASHFMLPQDCPDEINPVLASFLAS